MTARTNLILTMGVIVGLSASAAPAEGPAAGTKQPPVTADATQPAANRALVTIAKVTTVITRPLRKDGYPDYVAALNESGGKDVSPQDNAVVLLWQAIGPAPMSAEDRAEYFRLLAVPVPPAKGAYFVALDSFIKQDASRKGLDAAGLEAESVKVSDELEVALKTPWSEKDHPLLAAWLAVNEKPLQLVVEASRRPKFFDPLVTDEKSGLIAALLPLAQFEQHLVRALVARATLRLREGKTGAAWGDLLAVHRVARLTGRGSFLVEALVADTYDGIACGGDQALLQSTRLTPVDAMRMREDLAKLPPLPAMAEKIDRGERFMYLDSVGYVARTGISSLSELVGIVGQLTGEPRPAAKKTFADLAVDFTTRGLIDWNAPLRAGNSWYDRIVQALRKPTEAARLEALQKIDSDMRLLTERARGWKSAAQPITRREASQLVSDVFVALLLPATYIASVFEYRAAMRIELTKLAFSLAAYRADHGQYPAKVDELTPKYTAEIPLDIFIADKLHYRPDGDGYLLYSVGFNQIDDGGRTADEDTEHKGWDDIVVRMPKSK